MKLRTPQTEKTQVVSMRMPVSFMAEVKEFAVRDNRSMTAELIAMFQYAKKIRAMVEEDVTKRLVQEE
jgi:hypothetical protein